MKLDKEYSTSWVEEMKWLRHNNIRYEFVKIIDGVTVYKYKKTAELFDALAKFYTNKE